MFKRKFLLAWAWVAVLPLSITMLFISWGTAAQDVYALPFVPSLLALLCTLGYGVRAGWQVHLGKTWSQLPSSQQAAAIFTLSFGIAYVLLFLCVAGSQLFAPSFLPSVDITDSRLLRPFSDTLIYLVLGLSMGFFTFGVIPGLLPVALFCYLVFKQVQLSTSGFNKHTALSTLAWIVSGVAGATMSGA